MKPLEEKCARRGRNRVKSLHSHTRQWEGGPPGSSLVPTLIFSSPISNNTSQPKKTEKNQAFARKTQLGNSLKESTYGRQNHVPEPTRGWRRKSLSLSACLCVYVKMYSSNSTCKLQAYDVDMTTISGWAYGTRIWQGNRKPTRKRQQATVPEAPPLNPKTSQAPQKPKAKRKTARSFTSHARNNPRETPILLSSVGLRRRRRQVCNFLLQGEGN